VNITQHGREFVNIYVSKLTYCAPSWSGACSATDHAKLESFISRCKELGYCSYNQLSYNQLISDADESFFKRVITHDGHALQSLLPDRSAIAYNLRERTHNTTLIPEITQLNDDDFLIKMYTNQFTNSHLFTVLLVSVASDNSFINECVRVGVYTTYYFLHVSYTRSC